MESIFYELQTADFSEKLNSNLVKLESKQTIDIKAAIAKLGNESNSLQFAKKAITFSFALSNRNIAPRWQGFLNAGFTESQHRIIFGKGSLSAIMDLYFIYENFKQDAPNSRWCTLFSQREKFDFELATSISNRKLNTCRIIDGLGLSVFQQTGLIHFQGNAAKDARERATRAIEERKNDTFYKSPQNGIDTERLAQKRKNAVYALKLEFNARNGDKLSPTNAAIAYCWITGKTIGKSELSKIAKQFNVKATKRKGSRKKNKPTPAVIEIAKPLSLSDKIKKHIAKPPQSPPKRNKKIKDFRNGFAWREMEKKAGVLV